MATNYFQQLGFGQPNPLAGIEQAQQLRANQFNYEQAQKQAAAQEEARKAQALQFQSEQQKQRAAQGAGAFYNALNSGNAGAALQIAKQYEGDINALGDPSFTTQTVAEMLKTPEGVDQLKKMSLGMVQMAGGAEQFAKFTAGQQVKPMTAYEQAQIDIERNKTKQKPFEQGTGKAAGFVFDPNTGAYAAAPQVQEAISQAKAESDAKDGKVDAKTVISLNDKIGGLTKDAMMIHNTAKDISKLKKIGSGPAAISIVYKFMKSLDPTSVVREGEFATAKNAGGVPDNIMNFYNRIASGEILPASVIDEFERTAMDLSDSAAESADGAVGDYLNTFEDQLPQSLKDRLKARVPKRFNVQPTKQRVQQQAPAQAIEFLRNNPQLKEQFLAKYGYIPEGL